MLLLLCGLGAAGVARGQEAARFLPSRPEIKVTPLAEGEDLYTVRGRDCRASDFLQAMVQQGRLSAVVDPLAEIPLQTTIVTIDLHERRPEYIMPLIAAASGVDVEREIHVYRFMGPPRPGSREPRNATRLAAQRFYEMALLNLSEPAITAAAQRGLAELHRRNHDYVAAASHYEALLGRFPESGAARDSEILLAECYAAIGDKERARLLLVSFLDTCSDSTMRDSALRRLLSLFLEQKRYADVENLRDAFLKLDTLSPPTLRRLSDAASELLEDGRAASAVRLLQDLWARDPQRRAILGPVLALGMAVLGDEGNAATVLQVSCRHLGVDIQSSTALMAFAEIANRAGRLPESLVFAHRALQAEDSGPTVQRRAHLQLADLYRQLGMIRRARAHLYGAEQLSSAEQAGRLALQSAELALDAGQPEEARLLFQETLLYENVRVDAELGICRALLAAGEPHRAREVLVDLLKGETTEATRQEIRRLGIDALEALGQPLEARRLLRGDLAALSAAPAAAPAAPQTPGGGSR